MDNLTDSEIDNNSIDNMLDVGKAKKKDEFVPLPKEYFDFLDSVQQYYHLAHSVRTGLNFDPIFVST